jgi:phosphate butyryltransferase
MIQKLSELPKVVKDRSRMTVAVAAGEDENTIQAVVRAVTEGLIQATLVGDQDKIHLLLKGTPSGFRKTVQVVHETDKKDAAHTAVQMVHDGKAGVVMKGLITTSVFLKAVLDKEHGLVPEGGLLSHLAVLEAPTYPKLIFVSDAGVVPFPTLEEKILMLKKAIEAAHAFGVDKPKAALISASETVSPKIPSSMEAALIKVMADRKQITGAVVDGPLAVDVALSKESCEIKGLESGVHGEADILIFPNIESANAFYKCVTILSKGRAAAILTGGSAPMVLTSRADDDDSKFYSIALAALLASHRSI